MKSMTTYLATLGAVAALGLSMAPTGSYAQSQKRQNRIGNVETLTQLLEKPVLTSNNQQVGRLQNLILDLETGRVLYGIIDTSGELGNQYLAVPPGIFRSAGGNALRLSVDQQALRQAPRFNQQAGELGDASFVAQVYRAFNQKTWWVGGQPASQGSFNNVHSARHMIRTDVLNVEEKPMGQVRTAAVDLPAGRVVFVILNPSSDLNLGNQLFALPPNVLTKHSGSDKLVANITRDKLNSAPRFQTGRTWPIDNRQFAARVYQFYGKQPYFETDLQPTGRDDSQIYRDDQYLPNEAWESQRDDRDFDRDDRDFRSEEDRFDRDDRWQQEDNLWYENQRD